MRVSIKLTALLLALLMLVSVFVSCDSTDNNVDDESTSGSDTVASTEVETEAEPKTKLPEMNWEGKEYRIIGRLYSEENMTNFEVDRDEMPEDVVGLAVWNRNNALLQKYGIDVVGNLVEKPADEAKVFLEAGDDLYDLLLCQNNKMQPLATAGHFVNINNLNYIDFEQDCWSDYVNSQLNFGGKLYYTSNKFMIQDKHRTWIVWYNRTLSDELKLGRLEQEVFDGTWTMDRMIEISKTCVAEVDGQQGMSSGDRWGVILSNYNNISELCYGCGFRLSDMGSDGYPELVGATDQMLSIIDKFFELVSDSETCFVQGIRLDGDKGSAGTIFREGRAVVMTHALSWLSNLYKVDFEYGVLPAPKYTEEQERYLSIPGISNSSLLAVPATVGDIAFAGFALEAISEEAVDTSYKEYIDTKCKLQVAYDEDMSKCLNIIFDSIVYDITYIDDYGGLCKSFEGMTAGMANTWSRNYDKYKKRAANEIKQIKEAYEKLEY